MTGCNFVRKKKVWNRTPGMRLRVLRAINPAEGGRELWQNKAIVQHGNLAWKKSVAGGKGEVLTQKYNKKHFYP